MDREAWRAAVHGVAKSRTRLSNWTEHAAATKSLQPCPTLCDPIRRQPTRLPHPWDSPGKNTGVGCHCLLRTEHEWTSLCWVKESRGTNSMIPFVLNSRTEQNESIAIDIKCWLSSWEETDLKVTQSNKQHWGGELISIFTGLVVTRVYGIVRTWVEHLKHVYFTVCKLFLSKKGQCGKGHSTG